MLEIVTKPQQLQKLKIGKSAPPKNQEEESENEEILNIEHLNLDSYIFPTYLSSFRDIPKAPFTVFDFTGFSITSFEGIDRFTSLENLNVSKTLISSFKFAAELPKLSNLDFRDTPLSSKFYIREMALFAFGFSLQTINGCPVSTTEFNLSTLGTRAGISNCIRNGDFLYSYPSTKRNDEFLTRNFGFCSANAANEISTTFEEFNEIKFLSYNNSTTNSSTGSTTNSTIDSNSLNKNTKDKQNTNIPTEKMVLEMNRNISNMKKCRTSLNNQTKWFSLQNYRNSSENNEIESLRMQINGLRPTSEYIFQMNQLSNRQKEDEKTINMLQNEIDMKKTAFTEVQKCLRLATEMNFNLQLKMKDVKAGKEAVTNDEIAQIQTEINELKERRKEKEITNEKLRNEINLYQSNNGRLHNDLNNVLLAAESLKKEKENSERSLNSMIETDNQQQKDVSQLKSSLKQLDDENEMLKNQLLELDEEIPKIINQKDKILKQIKEQQTEFANQLKEISDL